MKLPDRPVFAIMNMHRKASQPSGSESPRHPAAPSAMKPINSGFLYPRRSPTVPSMGPSTATMAVEMLMAYPQYAVDSALLTPSAAARFLNRSG